MRYDYVIKNVSVIDGTGAEAYTADVCVKDEEIVKIRKIGEAEKADADNEAAEVIDGTGKILTPGFIDIHSHADLFAPRYPEMENLLLQGVTTVFAGQCGMGTAPAIDWCLGMVEEGDLQKEIMQHGGRANLGMEAMPQPREKMASLYESVYKDTLDWTDWASFETSLLNRKISINMLLLVGHGALRVNVMGEDCCRIATEEEKQRMCALFRQCMEQGANGISFGFDYAPGNFADEDELLRLASVAAEFDGFTAAHVQYGKRRGSRMMPDFQPLDGYRELLEIGLKTGSRVQVSHLRTGFKPVANQKTAAMASRAVLELIEEYRQKGVRVGWDVLPNYPEAGTYEPMLASKIGVLNENIVTLSDLRTYLSTEEGYQKVLKDLSEGNGGMIPMIPDWPESYIVTEAKKKEYIGCTLAAIAHNEGKKAEEAVLDLLKEDTGICVRLDMKDCYLRGFDEYIMDPGVSVGLDVECCPLDCQTVGGEDMAPSYKGGYADFGGMEFMLGRNTHLSKEYKIRAITGSSAEKLGLTDRGVIREGAKADLVLIDWSRMDGVVDYLKPNQPPKAIEIVWVNGKIAARNGVASHAGMGRILHQTNV